MKAKITKKTVDSLAASSSDFFVWDTEIPLFGIKITPKGNKIYVLQYRFNGRLRRFTIGKHGTITPDHARREARKILGLVASGVDPANNKQKMKSSPTIKEFFDRYLSDHALLKKKPRSVAEDKRLMKQIIEPFIGNIKVKDITRKDIIRLHQNQRHAPYQANRAIALLSKMMNLAEKWDLRQDGTNPVRHIEKYKETKRKRFLNMDELSRLGDALANAETSGTEMPSTILAVKLLLLTGARVTEVLQLKWNHIDFDNSIIQLPDSKTGAKTIPLGEVTLKLLTNTPRLSDNPYVCFGRKPGSHLVGLPKAWGRIRENARLEDVRLHDLRHTFASWGASAGLGLPIIGALLGHKEPSTTARYSHLALDPLKLAVDTINNNIDAAMNSQSNNS